MLSHKNYQDQIRAIAKANNATILKESNHFDNEPVVFLCGRCDSNEIVKRKVQSILRSGKMSCNKCSYNTKNNFNDNLWEAKVIKRILQQNVLQKKDILSIFRKKGRTHLTFYKNGEIHSKRASSLLKK